jgi:histidinol-phosphate phosphatase family protein
MMARALLDRAAGGRLMQHPDDLLFLEPSLLHEPLPARPAVLGLPTYPLAPLLGRSSPRSILPQPMSHIHTEPGHLNLSKRQRAIFLDRDGVLNREVDLLHRPDQLELLPDTVAALKAINRSEFLAIVITNQPVVARNLCSIEELVSIHKHLETLLGKHGAYLDAIYYCPHHPDKGYPEENPAYKIDCQCRKPKPGMVLEAARRYNIDLKASYLIGDRESDMICARNAGVMGILVVGGVTAAGSSRLAQREVWSLRAGVDSILQGRSQP